MEVSLAYMKLTSLLSTGTTWKERQIRLIFTNAPPTKHTAKLLEKYEAFFHLAPPPLRHFGKTETGKRRSNWRLLHTAPVNILWIILGSITKQGLGYKVTPNRITPSVTICLTGVFFIHYNILFFFFFSCLLDLAWVTFLLDTWVFHFYHLN